MAIPLTPFEQGGKVAWTPIAEEPAWTAALLAGTDRITRWVAGYSAGNTPMHLYKIGTGPRRVFWLGSQHGSEPAGRDAVFTILREWAETSDPDILDYLSKVTVYAMPTGHPDNIVNRLNPNGVDTNRDNLALTQPETRLWSAILRDYRPDIVIDLHEFSGSSGREFVSAPAHNINTDPQVRSWSRDLHDAVGVAIHGGGWIWGEYAPIPGPQYFTSSVGVRGSLPLLLESHLDLPLAQRHEMHLVAMDAAWRWHRAHLAEVADVVDTAPARMAEKRESIMLQSGPNTSGPNLSPPPRSYIVDSAGWEAIAVHREYLGITGTPVEGGYSVPMRQVHQTYIAYLFDPRSTDALAQGEPQGVPTPGIPIPRGAYSFRYRHNGVTYPATLKVKA